MSFEAYADRSFGSSACEVPALQDVSPPKQYQPPCSVEEALRKRGFLSEDEIRDTLNRIKTADAWLGPIALGDTEISA